MLENGILWWQLWDWKLCRCFDWMLQSLWLSTWWRLRHSVKKFSDLKVDIRELSFSIYVVSVFAVSALELHVLSRYPGNRQNDRQNDRMTDRMTEWQTEWQNDRQKHQQTTICLCCACAPRHNDTLEAQKVQCPGPVRTLVYKYPVSPMTLNHMRIIKPFNLWK